MMARLVLCEARKLLHGKAPLLLALAAVAMAVLTIASPAAGGPVFMSAGGRLDQVGEAIGFIGNWADSRDMAGSVLRTAFVYTPFWLLAVIVFAASVLSADLARGSASVSRAKGVSLGKVMVAKVAVVVACVGLLYGLGCFAAFLLKAGQHGVALAGGDWALFFEVLLVNVLLFGALVAQTALVVSVTRSAFASALVAMAMAVFVLLGYPSAFGAGEGAAGGLAFPLSPVFYLMHTCSLSLEGVPLVAACGYALVSSAIVMGAAAFALRVKEV